jgi:hypothetical protein
MDLTKILLDKTSEIVKTLSEKLGQPWKAEEVSVVAQIRVSNDGGESTLVTADLGKGKFINGELIPVKMLNQKEIEERVKAVKKN